EQRAVALAAADQRKPEPGIAGGGLDDGAAGLEAAVGLRRLDHGARRPVLERARRVCALGLEKQPAGGTIDARDRDERRVAAEIEHRCHAAVYSIARPTTGRPGVSRSSIRPAPGSPHPAAPWWKGVRNRRRRRAAIRRRRPRSPARAPAE